MAEFRDAIDIAAPPEAVFRLLVTESGITAWLGQWARLDPRPGGGFAVDVAGYPVRGEYLAVEPHRRVVVTWGFAGSDALPAGASEVEFLLVPTAVGTHLQLTHSGLPVTELAGHADGWTHFLPRAATVGGGAYPGPDDWRPLERPGPPGEATA